MLPYYNIVEYIIVINHSKLKILKLNFRAKPVGTASMYSYVYVLWYYTITKKANFLSAILFFVFNIRKLV